MPNKTKITESTLKDVRYGYLYSTGDMVLIHEIRAKHLGNQSYVTLHKYTGRCEFKGRIILSSAGVVRLAMQAVAISAKAPDVSNGSDLSKAKGQAIGHVGFQLGKRYYHDTVTLYELPRLISSDVTVQEDMDWTEPAQYSERWGDLPISKDCRA